MPVDNIPKDPTSYGWLTYGWVIMLSAWGGAVSWIRKVRRGDARPWNLAELIGELAIAGFVGVLTFWLAEAAAIDPLITAALVGISGHMGSRAIFALERMFTSRLGVPPGGSDGEDKG